MDYLPLFAELKQRPVLVIGGGEIAERTIQFLLRGPAQVPVVGETLSPALAGRLPQRQALLAAPCISLTVLPSHLLSSEMFFPESRGSLMTCPRLSSMST